MHNRTEEPPNERRIAGDHRLERRRFVPRNTMGMALRRLGRVLGLTALWHRAIAPLRRSRRGREHGPDPSDDTVRPANNGPHPRRAVLESLIPDLRELRGLEVGPLDRPLISKHEADVEYVDYFDEETLAVKVAKNPNRDPSKIVALDHVLNGSPISKAVNGQYDYLYCSHVMEHLPDLLGWLADLDDVLVPNGRIVATIPDKRFCFDIDRPITTVGALLENCITARSQPSIASVFDQRYYHKLVRVKRLHSEEPGAAGAEEVPRTNTLEVAMRGLRKAQNGYVDCHCNVFTPESFREAVDMSAELAIQPFSVVELRPTPRNGAEFWVVLQRQNSVS